MGEPVSAAQNSSRALVTAFMAAALAWGTAAFVLLALAAWTMAFAPAQVYAIPLPPLILAFAFNALLASALYTAYTGGCPAILRRGFLWPAFLYVQGIAAAGFLAELRWTEWDQNLVYGTLWMPVSLFFFAALLPGYRRMFLPAGWFLLAALLYLFLTQLKVGFGDTLLAGCTSYTCAEIRWELRSWLPSADGASFALVLGFTGAAYSFVAQRLQHAALLQGFIALHFAAIVFLYFAGGSSLEPVMAPAVAIAWLIAMLAVTWRWLPSDAAARFFVLGAAYHAAAVWSGQLAGTRPANSLSHYTDWTVLPAAIVMPGLVLAVCCGAIYSIAAWARGGAGLHSNRLALWHFWCWALGIPLYNNAMWAAGAAQALMWRVGDSTGILDYRMTEALEAAHPYFMIRAAGALLLAAGAAAMAYNVWQTARPARR